MLYYCNLLKYVKNLYTINIYMKYYIFLAFFIFIITICNFCYSKKINGGNNKLLENIYFINLDESKDRLKTMNETAKKHNLKFIRYPAFHGKKINIDDFFKNKKIIFDYQKKPGDLGCALSHIYLWEKLIKKKHEYVLILEDDVILDDNFIELFDKYYKQVPDDWDMIHLGSSWLKGKKISENILKTNNTIGSYAILYKLNTLKELIKKKVPMNNFLDLAIGSFITENNKNSYAFYPPLIKHNNNIISDRQSMFFNKEVFNDKSQEKITLL